MTNEELAKAIKQGDSGLIPELWEHIRKFVVVQANRYFMSLSEERQNHTSVDDLIQSGYFGFLNAIEYYDPQKPYKFVTYMENNLKNAFAKEVGLRYGHGRTDAAFTARHLEEPANSQEDDSLTLLNTITAVATSGTIDQAIENVFNMELRNVLECALSDLSETEEQIIRLIFFFGQSEEKIAAFRGISSRGVSSIKLTALSKMRYGQYNRQLWEFMYCDAVHEKQLIDKQSLEGFTGDTGIGELFV